MTSQEMFKHVPLKDGYCFSNISENGEIPNWIVQIMPPDININCDKLFGYDKQEFLNKQYKA